MKSVIFNDNLLLLMVDVFISYGGQRDRTFAVSLATAINGLQGFVSRVIENEDDFTTKTWKQKVIDGLNNSVIFVVIYSSESVSTQWPNQEVGYAQALFDKNKMKIIIPVVEAVGERPVFISLKGFVTNDMTKIPYKIDDFAWSIKEIISRLSQLDTKMLDSIGESPPGAPTLIMIERYIFNSNIDNWLFDDTAGIYTYKDDVNLAIKRKEYEGPREFHEPWMDVFPDKVGHQAAHDIYYGSIFIRTELIVSVDGGRAYIPYPKQPHLTITPWQYKMGEIINGCYGEGHLRIYFDYLDRARITRVDANE